NRKMMDEMANHATRIRRYIDWYGVEEVESFVDKVLSIDNLIDYHSPYIKRHGKKAADPEDVQPGMGGRELGLLPTDREYMERYISPAEFVARKKREREEEKKKEKRFPPEPERDVMGFLMEYASLNRWQRDIM